jgi:hypothetical protein
VEKENGKEAWVDMIERILFWYRFKKNFKFLYIADTGMGYAPTGYNIITDQVYVRHSRCGYVTGDYDGDPWDRHKWVMFYFKHTRDVEHD